VLEELASAVTALDSVRDFVALQRASLFGSWSLFGPHEKEISHGRVSWQTR
jgi:hypothetical protein